MNYGFLKVAAAIPSTQVADCTFNIQEIKRQMDEAQQRGVAVVVFPELSITGYTCADLFSQQLLLEQAKASLQWLMDNNSTNTVVAIVGMPIEVDNTLLNTAVVVQGATILGVVPKTYLPNYKEFYEKRWFTSADDVNETEVTLCGQQVMVSRHQLFGNDEVKFGIELCEDVWSPIPPSSHLALAGADLIFNLSATNELIAKNNYLRTLLAQQSARCLAGYIYSSCGFGESTQDLVYGGNALIYENGKLLAESQRFSMEAQLIVSDIDIENLRHERRINTTFGSSIYQMPNVKCQLSLFNNHTSKFDRFVNPHPFIPTGSALDERCEEIFSIQVASLAKRIVHTHAKTVVLGISGGLDSTLALLVCVRTMDKLKRSRKDIVGVTMPGFGTTDRTYHNALALMQNLGITIREIPIRDACLQHFHDIGHDPQNHDVTYENAQARERTQILMDIANQVGGFVVGTGDLSELALGWCTYNADHMSNYGVNCSVPKTLVRHLVRWVAMSPTLSDEDGKRLLLDIIDTPISPELTPADAEGNIQQKTEDLVGPYELHDFFLYHFLRHGSRPAKIYFLAQQAFGGSQKYDKMEGLNEPVGHYDSPTILHWLTTFCRRFFSQQFKRSCLPDGPKVGSVSLSPRGDWRMPSDASAAEWLRECETLH
ncbi:MAG: NAD(+) synthase [Bacteroidales bacterium]|nr:NAD(+) synthase [Bacteroidales bacterium]